jgi:hypothetical protein
MNRFCWFLLCFTLWAANAHSAELETRAVAFYYPWYGNPATDGRFANWNHAVAARGEAPRSHLTEQYAELVIQKTRAELTAGLKKKNPRPNSSSPRTRKSNS